MIRNLVIKVCGMREAENIRQIEPLVDWMGFIFAPKSPRFIAERPTYLPSACKRIGVFVNASYNTIVETVKDYGLNGVQLHGCESPELCRQLHNQGLLVIKAFPIASKEDLLITSDYDGCCDYFLFDTRCPGNGGSGIQFDWNVLEAYTGKTEFLLSGGIAPDSVQSLLHLQHPRWRGLDLNSRFEDQPGLKNVQRLQQFLQQLNIQNH